MGLFNLKTVKPVEAPQAQIVSDLDAMVAHSVAFRLHGKVHQINPVSVKEFYAFTNAILTLQSLEKAESISPAQIIDLYQQLIQSVCETIERKDIEAMTQAQCGALLNLIIECVTGKAQAEEQPAQSAEKKSPEVTLAVLKSPQPSKWQRLVSFLAGILKRR